MTDRSELEVIIAGSAKDNMFADISSDVRCVKAALLYADRIRLVSPKLGYLEARMVYRSRILPQMLRENVRGHEKVSTGGQLRSPLVATKSPHWWPGEVPALH